MRWLSIALLAVVGCGDVIVQPISLELCLDGLDNEDAVDGLVDCEDPKCGDLTTCVPTDTPEAAGIVVDENEACPEGFQGGEELIHRGLKPGTCEGCGCEVGDTTCIGKLWLYADTNECYGDTGLSNGTLVGVDITSTCSTNPIYYQYPGGVRADITGQGTCTASGAGTPSAPEWQETVKFCRASPAGNGCAAAHACVPKAPTASAQCVLVEGAAACDGFASAESDWYTGVEDLRSCGACFCTAVGGDCSQVQVEIGSDYSCDEGGVGFGQLVSDNDTLCWQQAPYSPKARLVGAPTPAAGCTAAATPVGTLTPTGQQTLCCAPE
jgi:hypothetical protein